MDADTAWMIIGIAAIAVGIFAAGLMSGYVLYRTGRADEADAQDDAWFDDHVRRAREDPDPEPVGGWTPPQQGLPRHLSLAERLEATVMARSGGELPRRIHPRPPVAAVPDLPPAAGPCIGCGVETADTWRDADGEGHFRHAKCPSLPDDAAAPAGAEGRSS